jgi:hypothetical protein
MCTMTGDSLRRLQELAAEYVKGLARTRATKEANLASRPSECKSTSRKPIPCLPRSLADEKRVGSLTRPDRGARFTDARNLLCDN